MTPFFHHEHPQPRPLVLLQQLRLLAARGSRSVRGSCPSISRYLHAPTPGLAPGMQWCPNGDLGDHKVLRPSSARKR